jgi:diacylglycerol kinase family enzyme
VVLSADRPFDVYADGELVGPLPMTFRALRGALQVAVGSGDEMVDAPRR